MGLMDLVKRRKPLGGDGGTGLDTEEVKNPDVNQALNDIDAALADAERERLAELAKLEEKKNCGCGCFC